MAQAPEGKRPDNVLLGVGTIVGTVFALSLGDALIKSLGGGGTMGLWQLFAVRSLLAIPVLLVGAFLLVPRERLVPQSIRWIGLRAALLTAMWIAYYAALPLLPLAVAAAAYYTLPLFIVAFAARYGGEIVGRMQWAGVVLGFFGILLVLAPGTEAFEWAALLPLLSAVFYAAAMVLTRTHCRDEHPATLALALNAMFILVGVAGLLVGLLSPVDVTGFLSPDWTAMSVTAWRSIAILAGLILVASLGTAVAYQVAPASTVGTFDFAYVGFALIWGVVFFGERPDAMALSGIGLIIVAGVLAVQRPTRS